VQRVFNTLRSCGILGRSSWARTASGNSFMSEDTARCACSGPECLGADVPRNDAPEGAAAYALISLLGRLRRAGSRSLTVFAVLPVRPPKRVLHAAFVGLGPTESPHARFSPAAFDSCPTDAACPPPVHEFATQSTALVTATSSSLSLVSAQTWSPPWRRRPAATLAGSQKRFKRNLYATSTSPVAPPAALPPCGLHRLLWSRRPPGHIRLGWRVLCAEIAGAKSGKKRKLGVYCGKVVRNGDFLWKEKENREENTTAIWSRPTFRAGAASVERGTNRARRP
jgi:hypothetical protein